LNSSPPRIIFVCSTNPISRFACLLLHHREWSWGLLFTWWNVLRYSTWVLLFLGAGTSSYVLVASNGLLCTSRPSQQNLLKLVLPTILPYMTTHHHNLQSFAQVQQSTVKLCLLMFGGLMIPKKGRWKKKKKNYLHCFQATSGLSQCKAFCMG
jgi:hypothetical protein